MHSPSVVRHQAGRRHHDRRGFPLSPPTINGRLRYSIPFSYTSQYGFFTSYTHRCKGTLLRPRSSGIDSSMWSDLALPSCTQELSDDTLVLAAGRIPAHTLRCNSWLYRP